LESRTDAHHDKSLPGRRVAVTGGARGLGRALVEAFAVQGADVAFSYHHGTVEAQQAESSLRARGTRVFACAADACAPGQMARFVESAAGHLGGLDVLVNNAGVFRRTPLADLDEAALDEAFAVNVKAAVLATRAAAPHLRRSRGAVVNVASLGGLRPWPEHVAYCASKAALVMATRSLALALAPDVRVNAVAPGILDPPGAPESVRARVPLQRFGKHEETVAAVLFLAGAASYTTGEVLSVDGGRRLR
jgi:NAD(P)-dependent dehydrogenase (short-subunit alcohol dehydrogenase family)